MWDKVIEQGIDPQDVDKFRLDTEYMSPQQCRSYQELKYAKEVVDGRATPSHANAVRMKDGTSVELNPWVVLP